MTVLQWVSFFSEELFSGFFFRRLEKRVYGLRWDGLFVHFSIGMIVK